MRLIGLTGGIACGKSTVSGLIETEFGIPVIDCDKIARDVVRKVCAGFCVPMYVCKVVDVDYETTGCFCCDRELGATVECYERLKMNT